MITFEQANLMKQLGLPQKRHKSAKYYVTPDIIMDFEAIHDLKDAKEWFLTRGEVNVNWMDNFTYIPELIDVIGISTYNLTLETAIYQFIENHKPVQEETLKRTEEAINVTPSQVPPLEGKATLGVTEYDKTVHIDDRTYEGIEKIKQALKINGSNNL